jgi:hypothetical protein
MKIPGSNFKHFSGVGVNTPVSKVKHYIWCGPKEFQAQTESIISGVGLKCPGSDGKHYLWCCYKDSRLKLQALFLVLV